MAAAGSSSGPVRAAVYKVKRGFKAKTLAELMGKIQGETSDAENNLQHLLTQLSSAIKTDEMGENLRGAIEERLSPPEEFRPAFNVPILPGSVRLDFKSKDADGYLSAPEASLRSLLFISKSSKHVTVARGAPHAGTVPNPAHGVSGMAGVGKTTALIGLGHDADIQAHFVDGVLYMSIGATATVEHITRELYQIMRVTGANTSALEVQSSPTLDSTISSAAVWFHGKRILFLIDDIWRTPTCPQGYLSYLEGLLRGSPERRLAIFTRSLLVAAKIGSHVDFGARDPCGPISEAVFMAHVAPETELRKHHLVTVARGILKLQA